jgi:phage gpG-like protein
MPVRDVDHGWKKFRKQMDEIKADKTQVRVGILASSAERQGGEISNLELGMIHEFGAPGANIPQRSFLRATADQKKQAWGKLIEQLSKKLVNKGISLQDALGLLGQRASADIKNTITQGAGIPPPLKPETIRRKGSSRPLVDSGQLVASITYEVGEGK